MNIIPFSPLSWLRIAVAFGALPFATVQVACSKKTAGPPEGRRPVVPVLAGEAVRKEMPVMVRAIGRVVPPATVSVKPQVTGAIAEVHFKEGQEVEIGAPLLTIDRRPFEVALAQAQAARAQAESQEQNATAQLQRYATLDKSGTVAKEQVDQIQAQAKVAKAAVQSADAAVRNAELQLGYCAVNAPIRGRVGKFLVTAGNVVTANQTDLVVINQVAPIEVSFGVAERYLPAVQKGMAAGRLKVSAATDGPDREAADGELHFLDNSVRANSGTIELKATFANNPQVLWPGQFVYVRLIVRVDPDAIVVPSRAVQEGQKGAFVFLIKPDSTVAAVPVKVERMVEEEAVISEGLKGGERIVIDGQSRLSAGATVEVKSSLAAASGKPKPAGP